MKWSEVKGIRSKEEIGYFKKQQLESDKWSEVKGIRSEEEIGYLQKNRSWKVISEVKLREYEVRRKSGISKKEELESDKWSEVKWSEVKGIGSEEEIGYLQKTGVGKW